MNQQPRIDAHQHYWSIAHGDYGWLRPNAALAHIYRDFGPADLHPLLDAAGIDATVLVQAAPSEAETWRLLSIGQQPGSRVLGVVGWCELLAPDAAARITRLAAQPLLKGLRPMLQDMADPRWMLQPALRPAIDAMISHDLSFDALIKAQPQLNALLEFTQRHPALRIVIDHGAKPAIAQGGLNEWRASISRIARTSPGVTCKLSGLVTEARANWQLADLQPVVDHLMSEFGAQRLMWGSDWPVLNLAADYAAWMRASTTLLQALSAEQSARIFGANAAAFYRLPMRQMPLE